MNNFLNKCLTLLRTRILANEIKIPIWIALKSRYKHVTHTTPI